VTQVAAGQFRKQKASLLPRVDARLRIFNPSTVRFL
jgi:hypothetical protein